MKANSTSPLWTVLTAIALGPAVLAESAKGSQPAAVCATITSARTPLEENVANLLEAKLSVQGEKLVERRALKAILQEQLLRAAFTSEGVSARRSLGSLVKADLLLLIRERSREEKPDPKAPPVIELAIAVTDRGVRLLTEVCLWEPDRAEDVVNRFAQAVPKARKLAERDDLRFFAVPPFENQDLLFENAHLRQGCARMVEAFLLRLPNAVVVELAEAKAIVQEAEIGSQTISRAEPVYILGSFKTTRSEGSERFRIHMETRRGDKSLAIGDRANIERAGVAPAIEALLAETLKFTAASTTSRPSPQREANLLTERGIVFSRLGEWDQAYGLFESALLLDPDQREAHLRVIEGHTLEMVKGGKQRPGQKLYYDPRERLEHAEQALRHFDAVLRNNDYDERIEDLLIRLHMYHNLSGYDTSRDPDHLVPVLLNQYGRRLNLIYRLVSTGRPNTIRSSQKIGSYMGNTVLVWARLDFPGAIREALRFLSSPELPAEVSALESVYLLLLLMPKDSANRELYEYLLAALEIDAPARKSAVGFVRRTYEIHDQASYEAVLQEFECLAADGTIRPESRDSFRFIAKARLRRLAGQEVTPATQPATQVRLVALNPELRYAGHTGAPVRPLQITNWLTCSPDLEVAQTEQGLFILREGALHYLLGEHKCPMSWDGKYLWVAGSKALRILDAQGKELGSFETSDFEHGYRPNSLLATLSPGRACMISTESTTQEGYARPRTWATYLELAGDSRTGAKHAETVFEAKVQDSNPHLIKQQPDIQIGFRPSWMTVLHRGGMAGEELVLIDRGRAILNPLMLDLKTREVIALPHKWPIGPLVVPLDDWIYIASGRVDDTRHSSAIYRLKDPLQAPRLWIDFGRRPTAIRGSLSDPYYSSSALVGNVLHLIANPFSGIIGITPVWVAVDLTSQQTQVLMSEWPAAERGWPVPRNLYSSSAYGLVLISNGTAYRAEVPPFKATQK